MKYRELGDSGIKVSLICLGTMTWGEQNSREDALAQMDYALERGVNFWDAAEMYPVPPCKETQGETECCIGEWFRRTNRRRDVVLATKVTGRSDRLWIREGRETRVNRTQITEAINGSLKRLNTDYIDLYQIHWPDRRLGLWGEAGASYVHKQTEDETPILETMQTMTDLVKSGKVRCIGVSNETPWGINQYLDTSKQGCERIVSIQNSYSLLNRVYEHGLSEYSFREKIGLLAYSPLAMGSLSGKYIGGKLPSGSRKELYPNFLTRYESEQAKHCILQYTQLAESYSLHPVDMALAFVNSRPFVTSNIIGATTLDQLKQNIDSVGITISDELEVAIQTIHMRCKHPAAA
ncbi:MAG: aldo/keto reductase [Gammaproteobacteria bacterium]|nr:aldo/keto reductase [Gammaproteobacteria bacterium]